jgi:uncharacterized protein
LIVLAGVARMMKIPVLGLVGLLLLAVDRGILEPQAASVLLRESISHGFRLSARLHQAFLDRLGLTTDPSMSRDSASI